MTTFEANLLFLTVALVLVAYMAATTVETSTMGLVFRFGKLVRILDPGLKFIWPFIERVEIHLTPPRQHELPTDPEFIDRISAVPPLGKLAPFRINHPPEKKAYFYRKRAGAGTGLDAYELIHFNDLTDEEKKTMEDDPLQTALQSEIAVAVEWYPPTDFASVENFINNVSPTAGRDRTEEVRRRISDMVAFALQDLLGRVTMRHATEMMLVVSEEIQRRIEVLVGEKTDPNTGEKEKPWGIHISKLYIKQIYGGQTIATAMSNASAALANKQEVISIAEGEAQAVRTKAEADKFAAERAAEAAAYTEEQRGKGEAKALEAMATAMEKPNARFLATLDAAREVLPKTRIIMAPGQNSVLGGILALGETIADQTQGGQGGSTNP